MKVTIFKAHTDKKIYKITLDNLGINLYQQFNWSLSISRKKSNPNKFRGYLSRSFMQNGKRVHVSFHREILGLCNYENYVDHINNDSLDNRIINLRECSNSQNMANTKVFKNSSSGLKGVSYDKNRRKWRATVVKDYKQYFLGYFDSKYAAALAYNIGAKKFFGDFALINKIRAVTND